jgi:Ni,Fe-hydrogenase III component G
MDTQTDLKKAAEFLAPWTVKQETPEANRLDVYMAAENLLAAVEGHVEALYHFCEGAAVLTLRMSVPYSHAELDSICGILPAASLYEREFMEMFGVALRGSPDNARLLLADNWPEGVYPLRKSFTGLEHTEKEAQDGDPA